MPPIPSPRVMRACGGSCRGNGTGTGGIGLVDARFLIRRTTGWHGAIHWGNTMTEMSWWHADHADTCDCPECTGEPCKHGCPDGTCRECEFEMFGERTPKEGDNVE